jgi:predicted house-cleaning NTP pyrophosphatase (Maf/HAM1 superfamily)
MAKPWRMMLALTMAVTLSSACNNSQEEARRYIEQSEEQWATSVATSDSSVVQRILADDVVWVFDGRILNKAQAVTEAAQGPGPFLSNRANSITIRFFGDSTAVAQGSETWTMRKDSAQTTGRFVWTDTWVRRNGQWQIVAAEDVIVPSEAPHAP